MTDSEVNSRLFMLFPPKYKFYGYKEFLPKQTLSGRIYCNVSHYTGYVGNSKGKMASISKIS
ncbi:hypothetical protein NUITMVRA1_10490 [Aerococcus viridans]|nr:hypothetical protein NUITMVRA1_10490 [Aerococcus viridans]